MIGYEDLNKDHRLIVDGYTQAMVDIENILTNDCLGVSLIGHYLSYEGNEKAAEEFKDEIVKFLTASYQDLINRLSDIEAEEEG